jgi:hypothetical protein
MKGGLSYKVCATSQRLSHLRWRTKEKKEVTLCIAAECWEGERPYIAMCCDTRAERGGFLQELVGSEDVDKIRTIGPVTALLSGDETDADELLTLCEGAVRAFAVSVPVDESDLAMTKFLADLRKAASLRKKAIVEHHLDMTISMSHDEFVRRHRSDFLESHSREIWEQIRNINLGADILLCGYCGDEPEIVRLDRFGRTHWVTNYSVVGAGEDIAYVFLGQRDWEDEAGAPPRLLDCLYRIFEAKKAAQRNRHVGESTAFEILLPGGIRKDVTDECFQSMKMMYEARLKPPFFEGLSNCLRDLDDEKKESKTAVQPDAQGTFVGRRRVHDEMPKELRGKT